MRKQVNERKNFTFISRTDAVKLLQSAAGTPPPTTHLTVTSDLTPTLSSASFNATTATESAGKLNGFNALWLHADFTPSL